MIPSRSPTRIVFSAATLDGDLVTKMPAGDEARSGIQSSLRYSSQGQETRAAPSRVRQASERADPSSLARSRVSCQLWHRIDGPIRVLRRPDREGAEWCGSRLICLSSNQPDSSSLVIETGFEGRLDAWSKVRSMTVPCRLILRLQKLGHYHEKDEKRRKEACLDLADVLQQRLGLALRIARNPAKMPTSAMPIWTVKNSPVEARFPSRRGKADRRSTKNKLDIRLVGTWASARSSRSISSPTPSRSQHRTTA